MPTMMSDGARSAQQPVFSASFAFGQTNLDQNIHPPDTSAFSTSVEFDSVVQVAPATDVCPALTRPPSPPPSDLTRVAPRSPLSQLPSCTGNHRTFRSTPLTPILEPHPGPSLSLADVTHDATAYVLTLQLAAHPHPLPRLWTTSKSLATRMKKREVADSPRIAVSRRLRLSTAAWMNKNASTGEDGGTKLDDNEEAVSRTLGGWLRHRRGHQGPRNDRAGNGRVHLIAADQPAHQSEAVKKEV
ncbi:uncharacterized protein K452DRAFT_355998 [Aplosporella prunicola CBS 121167]|uniref:Uncharacterized protein n=1 Tax=Aplosporella prunicola CBS 121167 TaxID=1176127 RepID=A0A6A6BPD8_9PEZI|nr:uncharacterized protein K452DRAFT_355998 [Aplosporella prunicola CBS 121167]KAF2145568.1 hypothetical protein K452DRAFT_355998 [Aplosporella prunicola CBS 121167]